MKHLLQATTRVTAGVVTLAWLVLTLPAQGAGWLAPSAMVPSPDGKALFVCCSKGQKLLFVDVGTRRVTRELALPGEGSGVAVTRDGRLLYVTCAAPASQVCVVDTGTGDTVKTYAAGHTACSPVLTPDGKTLFICNRFDNDVTALEAASGKVTRRIPVTREPVAAAVTPDGKRLLVANHLHSGTADVDHVAAVVSVIDVMSGQVEKELVLPNGSGLLNDLKVSPDGRFAVVTHLLSRYTLPTSQLERGWMNTNAKTLIELEPLRIRNTVLLDSVDRGAANPWGVAWSDDGKRLVAGIAGSHEVSITDFAALLEKLGKIEAAGATQQTPGYSGGAPTSAADVPNDLAFLVGLRERRRLGEGDLGPRSVAVLGNRVFTANYFSDTLSVVEMGNAYAKPESIALGPKPVPDKIMLGELYFNDARICFQAWQTCASCHPGGARVDALNWDLLNDGIGNPKNTKSLLLAFQTPPAMSIGVRESAEAAVRAGIRHILFLVQPREVAEALDEYIKSLKPVPSPYLVKGKLSAAAERGQRIFRDPKTGCAQCHPGPLFTDLQAYDVGTRGRLDRDTGTFDTPTLVELWRTAPYFHDGSASTMKDVFKANRQEQHGKTSHLSESELGDLVEYVLSL